MIKQERRRFTLKSIDPMDIENYNQRKSENMKNKMNANKLRKESGENYSSEKCIKVGSYEDNSGAPILNIPVSISKSMTLEPELGKFTFGSKDGVNLSQGTPRKSISDISLLR